MLIVAGWLQVSPTQRAEYVEFCRGVVELARAAPGCLDFALTADSLDPGRVDIYERWETEEHLEAFRGGSPDSGLPATILDARVRRYFISGEADA